MPFISVTLLVLKLDKLILIKEEHPKNILSISVTLLVLKLDKLIFIIDSQSPNIKQQFFILFLNIYFIKYFPFDLNL